MSYSRDDKAWVYELWRNIRDETEHEVWIDQRLVPAVKWWNTILENIEACQCFIYIMSPKSIESIYCQAELDYAIALNKSIMPLMLKPCDYPTALSKRQIQHQVIADHMTMEKVLLKIEQGLNKVSQNPQATKSVPRPPVPSPQADPEQILETFTLAEEAAAEHNLTLAFQLFQQVIEADSDGLGLAAQDRLQDIQSEQRRAKDYANVKHLAQNKMTLKGAQAAWRVFKGKYPRYDPDNLAETLELVPELSNAGLDFIKKWAKPPLGRFEKMVKLQEALDLAWNFKGTRNADWTPIMMPLGEIDPTSPLPAMEMCLVPVGSFEMGNDLEGFYYDVEKFEWIDGVPSGGKQVIKKPYWIARYPITNAQWRIAVQARIVEEPKDELDWLGVLNAFELYQDPNMATCPVGYIDWFEARKFAIWANCDLLPENLWEYAARGRDHLVYPWGNDFVADNVVYEYNSGGKPNSVMSKPQGVSWVGAGHLSGNVWEWCLSADAPYPYVAEDGREDANKTDVQRVLRGGAWLGDTYGLRASARHKHDPDDKFNDIGFRCLRYR